MILPPPPDGFRYSSLQPDGLVLERHEPLILTYHTSGHDGAGYDVEAAAMLATLQQHGYGQRVVILDGGARTSWQLATLRKPTVISWALETFPVPVVWLDADARLRAPMALFDRWPGGDLGIRLRRLRLEHHDRAVWCSGTLYFAATAAARKLARSWAYEAAQPSLAWDSDQELLGFLASRRAERGELTIRNLPPAYYWFDKDRERHPNVQPVIEHVHASRQRAGNRQDGWRFYIVPTKGIV